MLSIKFYLHKQIYFVLLVSNAVTSTQVSSAACFHKVTLWSPDDTASTLPVTDQLTRHTGASKVAMTDDVHGPSAK